MIMKRIILALIAAMTLCSLVQAKNRTVTENDSLGNKKRVIELRDTTIDGKTVTDTLSIMTYEGSSSSSGNDKGWQDLRNNHLRHRHCLHLRIAPAHRLHGILLQLQEPESQIPSCRTGIGQRTTTTRRFL